MKDEKPHSHILVEKRKDLSLLAADLEKEPVIAVDLEADSMFHYQEKVCLLQISTPSKNILVDPLALGNLSPLAPVFADPNIKKVFHGADYDIRSLHRDFDIEVNCLFDTQIAAGFLGARELGLAGLLKDRFGVTLQKKYQKKDWSQRPLPIAMLEYAVSDTLHLLPLAGLLEEELRAKGRLYWVEEECHILSKVRANLNNDNPLFLKFRGAGKLDTRSLAVLEAILKFRDHIASRQDRPLFKVLGAAPVLEMVKKKPRTKKALQEIRGLGAGQIKTFGPSLLTVIRKALGLPEDALPIYPKKAGYGYDQKEPKVSERVQALKEWRNKVADDLGIDRSLVTTTAQIKAMAMANPKEPKDIQAIAGMRNWQSRVFGEEICALLNNQNSTPSCA